MPDQQRIEACAVRRLEPMDLQPDGKHDKDPNHFTVVAGMFRAMQSHEFIEKSRRYKNLLKYL